MTVATRKMDERMNSSRSTAICPAEPLGYQHPLPGHALGGWRLNDDSSRIELGC